MYMSHKYGKHIRYRDNRYVYICCIALIPIWLKRGGKDKRTVDCEINRAFVINIYPAASYSPRPLPAKYHQRWRA